MRIEVKHCNNIDNAIIEISEHKLNIKFAPNGTGKSTIAKAILTNVNTPENLEKYLLPFKYREANPENHKPEITGMDNVKTVMCFNEDYMKKFHFKENELMNNSFDILIRNDSYKAIEQEIELLVSETKKIFTNNLELELLISNLKDLGGAFKLTKTGISKASSGMKGLNNGNKIIHIPVGLESYKPFIQSENSVLWIDWQSQGSTFSENSDICPFCTSSTNDKKEQISKVQKEYDKNTIKNLKEIINIVEKLGDYFSDEAKSNLQTITQLKDGIEKEHETYIINIKNQIDIFVDKLEKIKTLSAFQFQIGEKVSEKLNEYILHLHFFSELNSIKMEDAIAPINLSIEELIKKAGILQGKINIQHKEIHSIVEHHQQNINNFLTYAGYKYKVEISGNGTESKLKLMHLDHCEHISGGEQFLSYGERNAFSLVLFMYECISKNPDIIILDDPISSFDKNKKYAILEMLFRRDSSICLKKRTVLMLTHDIEPIIDTVKALSDKFRNLSTASFLKASNGKISELIIEKDDIKTFSEICYSSFDTDKDDILKLIYLRRYYEIINDKSDAYQVISNVLHKRDIAVDMREPKDSDGNYPNLNILNFNKGCNEIKEKLHSFSYFQIVNRLKCIEELKALYINCQNGYEKLQIFRLCNDNLNNSVIQKFVNETYHIENEFICQIDPNKYDTIPEYVIVECNKIISTVVHNPE